MSSIAQTKRCTKCCIIKSIIEFDLHRRSKDGVRSQCKACRRIERVANAEAIRETNRKYRELRRNQPKPVREIDQKAKIRCKKCGKVKIATAFAPEPRNLSGISGTCKTCTKAWHAAYHQAHIDLHKAHTREYRTVNAEMIREKNHARYIRDIDKYRARNKRKYHAMTPIERAIDMSKKREQRYIDYQANPAKYIAKRHKRMAQQRANGGTFTAEEWRLLCQKYSNRCLCCGEQKQLTIDHVIPVSKGGRNDIANLQPLCLSCNTRKYDRMIDYRIDSPYEVK